MRVEVRNNNVDGALRVLKEIATRRSLYRVEKNVSFIRRN